MVPLDNGTLPLMTLIGMDSQTAWLQFMGIMIGETSLLLQVLNDTISICTTDFVRLYRDALAAVNELRDSLSSHLSDVIRFGLENDMSCVVTLSADHNALLISAWTFRYARILEKAKRLLEARWPTAINLNAPPGASRLGAA